MSVTPEIEYRVVPLERYIVTRFQRDGDNPGSREIGTYASPHAAFEVAYALTKKEHNDLGYPPADERIKYPRHPLGPEHDKSFAEAGDIVRAAE